MREGDGDPRTIYQYGRGVDGAATRRPHFVWVSLRDCSHEELASVQHEFNLPGPLVDDPNTPGKRPVLEVSGELVFAEIKTIRWVAAEAAVQIGKVQLVLGDGFVLTVDPDERAVERVSQDPLANAELAGAGPAAVLTVAINHAVESYGPVLSVLNDAVDEAAEAVSSAGRSRGGRPPLPPRPSGSSSGGPRPWPRCSTAWGPSCQRRPATGSDGTFASSAPT